MPSPHLPAEPEPPEGGGGGVPSAVLKKCVAAPVLEPLSPLHLPPPGQRMWNLGW